MVTYLLKKSYQHKTYKEIYFKDLWGDNGVFTTMWIFEINFFVGFMQIRFF